MCVAAFVEIRRGARGGATLQEQIDRSGTVHTEWLYRPAEKATMVHLESRSNGLNPSETSRQTSHSMRGMVGCTSRARYAGDRLSECFRKHRRETGTPYLCRARAGICSVRRLPEPSAMQ
jgi:hypothetical protein